MMPAPQQPECRTAPFRWIYLLAGNLLFGIGILGMVLPLLPTTVFWIGAAICFAKSSPAMYRKILTWPKIGPAIHDFLNHGIISTKGRHAALSAMAVCALIIVVFFFGTWTMFGGLVGIGIGAAVVINLPTAPKTNSPYCSGPTISVCPFLAGVSTPFPGAPRFQI